MATKLLSTLTINAEIKKHSQGEKLLSDGEGLFLRLRPGRADWIHIATLGGKRRKAGLGPYESVPLKVARAKADEARGMAAVGLVPSFERRRKMAATVATQDALQGRPTFTGLFNGWHSQVSMRRKDGGAEVARAFAVDVLPLIGARYADEVSRRDVMAVLDRVRLRGSKRQANVLLQMLRQLSRFAVVREIVPADFTFAIQRADVGGKEKPRERIIEDAEIEQLAIAMPAAKLPPRTEHAVWLMLSTLARVGELSRARVEQIDFAVGTWRIPAENTKNGIEHLVHLSAFATEHFRALVKLSVDGWLIPDRTGTTHIDDKAIQKQIRDRQLEDVPKGRANYGAALALPGGRWTAHDLRRSGATMMGELGVNSDVIDRAQNHKAPDRLRQTYQRQKMMEDRRRAFSLLGEHLAKLIEGRNVVRLVAA